MRRSFFLLLFAALASCQSAEESATSAPSSPAETMDAAEAPARARNGEDVVVFLTHVKADHREAFEGFLEFFDEAMTRIGADDPEFARMTDPYRILYPTEANDDGTWTYALMADPLYEGAETRLNPILARLYSEDEIAEHRKPWDDAMAAPQDALRLVQHQNMTGGLGDKASEGETVQFYVTHIKGDHRQSFEAFLDLLSDALVAIAEEDEATGAKTKTFRALGPAEPNEDGTLTYLFIADPLVDGTDMGIPPYLSRVYTDEEVDEHMKAWDDALARGQDGYRFVQSKFE